MKILKLAVFIPAFFVLAVFGFKVAGAQTIAPTIAVTAPAGAAGGQDIAAGSTYTVQWTASGMNNVNIYLCAISKYCNLLNGPSGNVPASQGSFSWYVDPNNLQFPGDNFRIEVSDVNSKVSAYSGYFSVTGGTGVGPTISSFTAIPSGLYGSKYPNAYLISWSVTGASVGQVSLTADCAKGLNISMIDDAGDAQSFQCGDIARAVAYGSGSEYLQFANTSGQSINENIELSVVGAGTKTATVTIPFLSTPTITSITPTSGTGNTAITIYGTNLAGATEVDFYNGTAFAAGIVRQNFTVSPGGTSLSFTLSGAFGGMVDPGNYQVKVVTPLGTSNGLNFTVTAPSVSIPPVQQAPTVSYITPSSAMVGATVTVYGANFDTATFIGFDGAYGTAIQPSSITLISPTELSFAVPSSLGVGAHTLAVAEKAGPWNLSSPVTLNVVASASTPPIMCPAWGCNGPQPTPIPITGSGASSPSLQAMQQELTQLISLLLQLLQQAAAQGLLSPSQLNSALNTISH